MPVTGKVHVGDGSTWKCAVTETLRAGPLKLYWLGGGLLALLEGASPVKWETAGNLVSETSVGGLFTDAALVEIQALREEPLEEVNEAIDEILDVEEDETGEGVVKTPAGERFAVFQVPAEGSYRVDKGIDGTGAVVALVVVIPES